MMRKCQHGSNHGNPQRAVVSWDYLCARWLGEEKFWSFALASFHPQTWAGILADNIRWHRHVSGWRAIGNKPGQSSLRHFPCHPPSSRPEGWASIVRTASSLCCFSVRTERKALTWERFGDASNYSSLVLGLSVLGITLSLSWFLKLIWTDKLASASAFALSLGVAIPLGENKLTD